MSFSALTTVGWMTRWASGLSKILMPTVPIGSIQQQLEEQSVGIAFLNQSKKDKA